METISEISNTIIYKEILIILKHFEQRDYKTGGVSIAPEMYDVIASEILKIVFSKCSGVNWRDCKLFKHLEWGCNDCDKYLYKKIPNLKWQKR